MLRSGLPGGCARMATLATPTRFPKYLGKQTSSGIGQTAAFDPKRTWRPLFLDHLVGAGKDRRRHGEADRFVNRKMMVSSKASAAGTVEERAIQCPLCRARSITRRWAVSEQRPEMRTFAGWP